MTDSPDGSFTPDPVTTDDATARFPWPPPEDAPIVAHLTETWVGATFHPSTFFRAMPVPGPLGAALLYYLVIGILSAAIQLFWGSILPSPETPLLEAVLGSPADVSPLVEFLLSPLYLLASLFIAGAVTHLMVLILVPGNGGIGTTLRVLCFAYSPILFGVIPYAGAVVGFIWMTVLSIIGLREAHRTTTGRAATAVLVPLVLAILFIVVASVLLVAAGTLLETR